MKAAACIEKKKIQSFGTCIGKFTHSRKFHLKITSLDILAPFAKNKVWLKKGSEQHFVYGKNILKASIKKLSESIDTNEGLIVCTSDDLPIGFGVSAKSGDAIRTAAPTDLAVIWQADV